jgi:hypothetical protein
MLIAFLVLLIMLQNEIMVLMKKFALEGVRVIWDVGLVLLKALMCFRFEVGFEACASVCLHVMDEAGLDIVFLSL